MRLKTRIAELKQRVKTSLAKFADRLYHCSYDIRFIFINTKPRIFKGCVRYICAKFIFNSKRKHSPN